MPGSALSHRAAPLPERSRESRASMRELPRVVAGIDFSLASLAAARWVGEALGPHVELVLVHALPPVAAAARGGTDARADAIVGALRGLAGLLPVQRVTPLARRGSVADVLAAVGAEMQAQLICIGRDEVDGQPALRLAARLIERRTAAVLVVPRRV
ncbi:UspA domain-containing protein (plasmid) [Gemmatirosa kalamazoonensis]|uniref:UspA domain-containing protein n=1 Tax=Gemmatirosa kalamazoonensis TaxID=861299 RepID=W0RSI7_9BACT|nr:universal stress protein [Gemmatirosa kalamazoonensis]AHG92553.1 UspA domain-containing protein [Gemmatirosa kalamazoonensis]